ncbi:MAG TPA: arginase family protein [Chitinophagaceae bacterium]|nr:arginase family protein [Chitinophagaceae bacterium]
MTDLSCFDPNAISVYTNNIFGLPFTEEESSLVIVPVPWEVTVTGTAGTARAPEHILKASLHTELIDEDVMDGWKQGFYMRDIDRKILLKSDYLRKEAELFINFIQQGEDVLTNKFMCRIVKEVNDGCEFLNNWVHTQSKDLIDNGKLVGVLGGDHSTALGLLKAIAGKHGDFGILQIDAHCNLRKAYENFKYSHVSVMYNALEEIPQIVKLVQVGVRDYSYNEKDYLRGSNGRIVTYFDKAIKERIYEGETWKEVVDDIVNDLPRKVYMSFDIDGLDPKLCRNTGNPVPGGFETAEVFYLFKKIYQSGRQFVGFDLSEVGISAHEWDASVGAKVLFKLCNLMVASKINAHAVPDHA